MPRTRWFVGLVALVVVCVVLARWAPPDSTRVEASCDLGGRHVVLGLLDEAEDVYRSALDASLAAGTDGACATEGLAAVSEARCAAADRLRTAGVADKAAEAYATLLADPTASVKARSCAIAGLTGSPPAPGTAESTAAPERADGPTLSPRRFLDRVLAGGRRFGEVVLGWATGASVDVGPGEALFLLSVGLVCWHLWQRRRLRSQPGSVDVDPLLDGRGEAGDSPTESTLGHGLAAVITDQLAGGGLMPTPAVPSGAMATQVIEVVESSPSSPLAWAGRVIGLVRRLVLASPRRHKLVGTVLIRDGNGPKRCGLAVELVDVVSGNVEGVATFWESTHEDAALAAAGFSYARVMNCVAGSTPLWQTWTNLQGESVTSYQRGLAFETTANQAVGDRQRELRSIALDHFKRAAALEPMNVLIQLRIANMYEQEGAWAAALGTYLDVLERWPLVFEARYRLAITLSFSEKLLEDPDHEAVLVTLDERLARLGATNPSGPFTAGPGASEKLLEAAEWQLFRLRNDHRWSESVRRWAATWSRDRAGDRERALHAALAKPWSRQRRLRRNTLGLARICIAVQLPSAVGRRQRSEGEVDDFLSLGRAKNWQVHYNAACCYSRLREVGVGDHMALATKAVRRLERAYDEARGHLELAWIDRDPDLTSLRGFGQFERLVRGSRSPGPTGGDFSEIEGSRPGVPLGLD